MKAYMPDNHVAGFWHFVVVLWNGHTKMIEQWTLLFNGYCSKNIIY